MTVNKNYFSQLGRHGYQFIARSAVICSGVVGALSLYGLTGCAVGPDYQPPTVIAPAQWNEASASDGLWQPAAPADAHPKGAWWEVFGDAQLNALEQAAQLGNLNLQVAVARLDQARALAKISRSALLPSIGLEGEHARTRSSDNHSNTDSSTGSQRTGSSVHDDNTLGLTATYELDLFGRVRRAIEAGDAGAQQAAADLENVRLLLAADVAANYFALRTLEGELAILEQSIVVQSQILDVVRARHDDGVANGIDLAQQELIVSSNRTQQQQVLRQYTQQRHALATLLGLSANELQLSSAPLPAQLPQPPALLPAELLQRRPDIASAERAVAIANAQIGVAHAGWFPSFAINAADGFSSEHFDTLFDAPSAVWSLGIAVSQTLFDGGRTSGREQFARAAHRQATAQYRNTVLTAWQEVEDGLADTHTLASAHAAAQSASRAAATVADITEDRYQAGLASAVERYIARQNALISQRQEQQLAGQRWVNAVKLVKALGGGWHASELASSNN
jgi:NodT family efflux transporter outer membrane factor (OMF) lipoprotein